MVWERAAFKGSYSNVQMALNQGHCKSFQLLLDCNMQQKKMPGLSSNPFLFVVVSLLFLSYFVAVHIEKNVYLYNRNVFRSPKVILANSETYERFQALANQSRIQVQFL